MSVSRYYQAVLSDVESDVALHVVVLPASCVPRGLVRLTRSSGRRDFTAVAEPLAGSAVLFTPPFRQPDDLLTLVGSLLLDRLEPSVLALSSFEFIREQVQVPDDVANFARRAVEQPLPFEASPLKGVSLRTVASMTGPSLGASAVAILSLGTSPLAMVFVAGSIVLFGAASGVASALRDGLDYRIRQLLIPPQPRVRSILTPRETEALQLMALGLPETQIAQRMGISRVAIYRYRIKIFEKLGGGSVGETSLRSG